MLGCKRNGHLPYSLYSSSGEKNVRVMTIHYQTIIAPFKDCALPIHFRSRDAQAQEAKGYSQDSTAKTDKARVRIQRVVGWFVFYFPIHFNF